MIDCTGQNEVIYYYHFDGLGSVIALSDINSDVVESYSYDVFGEPNTTSSIGNPYMFTARRYDSETANYYYRARFYDPSTGRFLQPDPIGYDDSMNLYQYCLNNPINFFDPFGLTALERIGFGEKLKVSFHVGLYDAMQIKNIAVRATQESELMTKAILKNSSLPEYKYRTHHDYIQNATLHALLSAYLYKKETANDTENVLTIHEKYSQDFVDTIVDENNNAIGKKIGLTTKEVYIYYVVKEAYYNGELYKQDYILGDAEPPTRGFSVLYSAHKALICKGLQAFFWPKMRITSG